MTGLAAISIEGPKAVGKTATAANRAHSIYELDSERHRQILEADSARLTDVEPPILIDEWQR